MKDLTKIYIDLSKCTEEQQKHIVSLLPAQTTSGQYLVVGPFTNLHFKDERWLTDTTTDDKTELTYPEFIKLFEDGEEETQVEHTCKYCGCLTTQPDSECYAAPKNQMETLYRKVAISERSPEIFKKVMVIFENGDHRIAYRTDNDYWYDSDLKDIEDPEYWLEEIPDPTAQLKAEKSELLEALQTVHELVTNFTADSLMLIEDVAEKTIQKMKQ